ncbi:MAG: VWA domain-containing protein [Rhodospirillaceae bacterium]|nr:VWA domain-containing protein [Rhodospirillaceae bacterium]
MDAFLRDLAATPAPQHRPGARGRLIFAMDATASREPTWDTAIQIQAEMFAAAESLGGLQVQLVHYRGFGEFRASPWLGDPAALVERMTAVRCRAGKTQIARVLKNAVVEAKRGKVGALVFVGDAMEEDLDQLGDIAGRLGLLGVRAFIFHEGRNEDAGRAFRHIARLTGGACCAFDASSPRQLRDLLAAVAVYVAGGRAALEDYGRKQGGAVLRLTHQMR